MSFNDNEEALAIFGRIVQKEPENKVIFLSDFAFCFLYYYCLQKYYKIQAAQQQILLCKQKIKELEEKDRRRFKGIFAKMAKENAVDEVSLFQSNKV